MQIKFINLNLWEGGKLKENVIKFLQKEKPDVLTLQEVTQTVDTPKLLNLDYLPKGLDLKNYIFSPQLIVEENHKKVYWGNTIFSKFPIIKSDSKFYDLPLNKEYKIKKQIDWTDVPRNLQHAVINLKGTQLNAFNTQGIWGFNGNDSKRRLKMGQTITRALKDKENVILAGDLNVKEKSKTIQQIEKYLKNVFKGERTTSFNMKRKNPPGGYATAVVDFVFVSPNIKVISHICPQVDISDHLPQVCVFEI